MQPKLPSCRIELLAYCETRQAHDFTGDGLNDSSSYAKMRLALN